MKKIISSILVGLMVLGMSMTAFAEETSDCIVTADTVAAAAGDTVAVPIRIMNNPGFTNFHISLTYDEMMLELTEIQTKDGDTSYLDGALVSANTSKRIVTCASGDAIQTDGILFVAVFKASSEFSAGTQVTPVVSYMRCNQEGTSEFTTLDVSVQSGNVVMAVSGDVDGSSECDYDDVMLVYSAYLGQTTLTGAQQEIADMDDSGEIDYDDVMFIYNLYIGAN